MIFFFFDFKNIELMPDNDNEFHDSYGGYLTYVDNTLAVNVKNQNKVDLYCKNNKHTVDADKAVKYKENLIFNNQDGLHITNENTHITSQLTSKAVTNFVVDNDKIYYCVSLDTNIYLYNLNSQKIEVLKSEHSDCELIWFDVNSDFIYSIYLNREPVANKPTTKQYILNSFDKETLNLAGTFDFTADNRVKFYLCNNTVFLGETLVDELDLYLLNIQEQKKQSVFEMANVESVSCNDRYIVFNVHEYVNTFFEETTDSKYNGLWQYDSRTDKLEKLSDMCVFDDIMLTENYVYTYENKYFLPRGWADSWIKGYNITQIPLSYD